MFFLPLLKDIPLYHSSYVFKTIYALSTPLGKSAVALIRISGPESFRVVQALCPSRKLPKLRYMSLREIRHPKTNELLDKACVLLFKGPFSFTGEDMAELHVHGGPAVIRAVLDAISSSDCNVQYAEAGDFSRRSYENGKLDLTQAEGLYDIINAETEEQRKLAVRQVEGFLKSLYDGWRDELIDYRSHLEAIIDFGEDDDINDNIYFQSLQQDIIGYLSNCLVYKKVEKFVIRVQDHLKESVRCELLRHGIKVSIFGLPNVGKSSLLNIIAKRSVSIVSSEPGTTRDIIDVVVDIGGFPVIFSDTAGLREENSLGFVEKEGIKRAYENIEKSFMRICVLDITDIEANVSSLRYLLIHQNTSNQQIILVLNKIDLLDSENFIFPVSCNTNAGIRDLIFSINNQLRKLILFENSQEVVGANARHREHLEKCLGHLQIFLNGNIKDIVIGADNLRYASDELGKICGRIDIEEVLGAIFSKFCIGK